MAAAAAAAAAASATCTVEGYKMVQRNKSPKKTNPRLLRLYDMPRPKSLYGECMAIPPFNRESFILGVQTLLPGKPITFIFRGYFTHILEVENPLFSWFWGPRVVGI